VRIPYRGCFNGRARGKGQGQKTVYPFEERLEIVRQIRYVDRAIAVDFDNTDKLKAWKQLHYDCHFAGSDHEEGEFWLKKQLQTVGSNAEFFPYTDSTSSTALKRMIDKSLL
jgi:glycerol-3-phosphate cytidylyltransferase-like family protein